MYVKEAKWYLKQQRRRSIGRRVGAVLVLFSGLLVIWLCSIYLLRELGEPMHMDSSKPKWMPVELVGGAGGLSRAMEETLLVWNTSALEELSENRGTEALPENGDTIAGEVSEGLQASQNEDMQGEHIVREEGKYLIVIDAGHGGEDEGCSFEQIEEKKINLKLAMLLKEKLEELEFQVLLTRAEDRLLGLEERVRLANGEGADAFISIHQNACEDTTASGVETYYYASDTVDNERLARLVEQYVLLYTKGRDRGIRETDKLYVIRETGMPSCLVETGFLSNPAERQLLQEEGYLDKVAQGLADAVQLYFYPKTMYLTFDDGPVAENTDRVLDVLKEKGIKATFFLIGKNVERNPGLAKRIVEEGHTIGIHCYQHDYQVLYESVDSFVEDFERARQVVLEVTGVEAKLFRFPGGSINSYNEEVSQDIIEEMTAQGYVYFDWNAGFEDAVRGVTAEKIKQNAKESTLGRKKVVMLAHDIVDETAECLEEVLELFPEYEMKALTEDVIPVQF